MSQEYDDLIPSLSKITTADQLASQYLRHKKNKKRGNKLPTRRINGFLIFRNQLAKNKPNLSQPKISKIAGAMWKQQTDQVKAEYKRIANEVQDLLYQSHLNRVLSSISPRNELPIQEASSAIPNCQVLDTDLPRIS